MKLPTQKGFYAKLLGSIPRHNVIQPIFSAHFFCNTTCHQPTFALLRCLTTIAINTWVICIRTHAVLQNMLLFLRLLLPAELVPNL